MIIMSYIQAEGVKSRKIRRHLSRYQDRLSGTAASNVCPKFNNFSLNIVFVYYHRSVVQAFLFTNTV